MLAILHLCAILIDEPVTAATPAEASPPMAVYSAEPPSPAPVAELAFRAGPTFNGDIEYFHIAPGIPFPVPGVPFSKVVFSAFYAFLSDKDACDTEALNFAFETKANVTSCSGHEQRAGGYPRFIISHRKQDVWLGIGGGWYKRVGRGQANFTILQSELTMGIPDDNFLLEPQGAKKYTRSEEGTHAFFLAGSDYEINGRLSIGFEVELGVEISQSLHFSNFSKTSYHPRGGDGRLTGNGGLRLTYNVY